MTHTMGIWEIMVCQIISQQSNNWQKNTKEWTSNELEFGGIQEVDLPLQELYLPIQNFMTLPFLELEIMTIEIMRQIGVKNGKVS